MKIEETWVVYLWRPMMGWVYMLICLFDFMFAPIFFTLVGHASEGAKWQAVTTQGGSIFHLAMLTILGVTAWGRNLEKLKQLDLLSNIPGPQSQQTPPTA